MKTTRYDTATVKAKRTDEGFILDDPIITRTGVFKYRNTDGTERLELRHPDDVFKPESLATLKGKPITNLHQGEITAQNAFGKIAGAVLTEGRQDGENVTAEISILDTFMVDSGSKELSCGYDLNLIEENGVYNGEKYTHRQTNIVYNHLAIVPNGRAGNARLNMDAQDFEILYQQGATSMKQIRLDNGIDYEVAPEVAQAFDKLRQDAADAKQEAEQAKADAQALNDSLPQVQADAVAEVKQRLQLESDIKALGVEFNKDADDRALKVALINASGTVGWMNLDTAGDAYIDAAFDMSLETMRRKSRQDAADADEQAVAQQRQDAANTHTQAVLSADEIRKQKIEKGEL